MATRTLNTTLLETIHLVSLAYDGIGAGRYSEIPSNPFELAVESARPVCLHGIVRWLEAPAGDEKWFMNMSGLTEVLNKAKLGLTVVDEVVRKVNVAKHGLPPFDTSTWLPSRDRYDNRISFEEFCEATELEPVDDGTEEYGVDWMDDAALRWFRENEVVALMEARGI